MLSHCWPSDDAEGGSSASGAPGSSSHMDWPWVTETTENKTADKEGTTAVFDSTIPPL